MLNGLLFVLILSTPSFSGFNHRTEVFLNEGLSRPQDPDWNPHEMVSRLLYDFKHDDFYQSLEQQRQKVLLASLTELEHIDLETKKNLVVYEKILKKVESLKIDSEEVKSLLIELKSRVVLSVSLQHSVTKRINNDLLNQDLETLSEELLKGPQLALPERIWHPPKPLVIEPK